MRYLTFLFVTSLLISSCSDPTGTTGPTGKYISGKHTVTFQIQAEHLEGAKYSAYFTIDGDDTGVGVEALPYTVSRTVEFDGTGKLLAVVAHGYLDSTDGLRTIKTSILIDGQLVASRYGSISQYNTAVVNSLVSVVK